MKPAIDLIADYQAYELFLTKYPKSDLARSAIYYRDRAALEEAKKIGTTFELENFLST